MSGALVTEISKEVWDTPLAILVCWPGHLDKFRKSEILARTLQKALGFLVPGLAGGFLLSWSDYFGNLRILVPGLVTLKTPG
jgi:hypothetical protein